MISLGRSLRSSVTVPTETLLLLLLLLLLLTTIELSLGGSIPYTSTDKTNKNKYAQTKQYTQYKQYKTINTSTHITKTPTHYKTHTYTHPHITKQVQTSTAQDAPQ